MRVHNRSAGERWDVFIKGPEGGSINDYGTFYSSFLQFYAHTAAYFIHSGSSLDFQLEVGCRRSLASGMFSISVLGLFGFSQGICVLYLDQLTGSHPLWRPSWQFDLSLLNLFCCLVRC